MLASSKSGTDIASLLHGYQLCATTEGKSPNSLAVVINSMRYLYDFLCSNALSTDVTQIGAGEMRAFILYLQQSATEGTIRALAKALGYSPQELKRLLENKV